MVPWLSKDNKGGGVWVGVELMTFCHHVDFAKDHLLFPDKEGEMGIT